MKNVLKNLGLGEKQAKIYLACLELGSATVSEISNKSKVNRVTCYDILEKLLQKGFINYLVKDKTKYFSAVKPDTVYKLIKQKTEDLKKILPDLKRLQGVTAYPKVRYFEGLNGIKAIYEDTLTSKTEILNFSNSTEIRDYWPGYDKEYVQKRKNRNIFLKGISPMDEEGLKVRKENKKYYRNIKLIPKKSYDFSNEINIYDNKVAIISFKDDLIGMIIESSEIADTQRTIFKMVWEFANKFKN